MVYVLNMSIAPLSPLPHAAYCFSVTLKTLEREQRAARPSRKRQKEQSCEKPELGFGEEGSPSTAGEGRARRQQVYGAQTEGQVLTLGEAVFVQHQYHVILFLFAPLLR